MKPAHELCSEPPRRSYGAQSVRPTVLYLVNQYPAISHTFIKREVLALERAGVRIIRVAARATGELVDPGDIEEERRTTYLLRRPRDLLQAAAWFLFMRPHRFASALAMTFRMMRRSDRGVFFHIFYFIEACGVASLVRTSGATHIHAHFGTNPAEVAMLASQLSGATYSFTVHGCDEFDRPEFLGLRAKIRNAAFVTAVSYFGRAQLYRWCDRADRDKIKLIRCGLEHNFHNTENEAPCEPARFLSVGRLCRLKGQDILVKAAAMMAAAGHKFEVVIVGDGEERAELEAIIDAHRLSGIVQLRGWLSSAEVRQEMIRARALVVSSLIENLPVVIMEAMALQRVVVATQVAGIPELVIPRETGWLAPAGSVEALAAAMTQCLLTPREELRAMGRRGRELVLAQHDVDREAAALANLYAGGASDRKPARDISRAAIGPVRTAWSRIERATTRWRVARTRTWFPW